MIDFISKFKSEAVCLKYLAKMRWGDKVICPHCRHGEVWQFKDKIRYKCQNCKKMFNAKTKTIFHNTKVPLPKWFLACYLLTCHKKGVSSLQLSRDIGVTQKTAWNMLMLIRSLFTNEEKIRGDVEVDEAVFGGLQKNKHFDKKQHFTAGRSLVQKTGVVGMIERGGRVRAVVVKNFNTRTIKQTICENIEYGGVLLTDEYAPYKRLDGFLHFQCNHSRGKYVDGIAHTNNIECFWKHVKATTKGTYHWVSAKYLQLYLNTAAHRYNTRSLTGAERIASLLKGA